MGIIHINPFVFRPAPSGITVVNVAQSNLSISNRTTHNYTYNFVSTVQDGTVGLAVLFLGDDGDEPFSFGSTGVELIGNTTHSDLGGMVLGFYEPTSGDLSTGSKLFNFTTTGAEVYQYVIIEMHGVDLSNPYTSYLYNGSNNDRTTVGPGTFTVTKPNSLCVVAAGSDDSPTTLAISMSQANGFTEVAYIDGVSALPVFMVATKLATTAGSHSTPQFSLNSSNELGYIGCVFNPA